MIRQFWQAVRPLTRQQRFLYAIGALLIASGLVHSVIALFAVLGGEPFDGPVSWRKPVVFGLSVGLTALAYAWVLRQLPARKWGWIPTAMFGIAGLVEVAIITMQKWRGVASHFNVQTDFDTAAYFFMAQCVVLIVVATLIYLVWVLAQFRGTSADRVAAIVGIVAILVAGYIGGSMIEVGETYRATTGELPWEVVFGADGSAKLAHFLGLHGIQFLAVLSIVSSPARRLFITAVGAASYLLVFTSVTLTAYDGRSWLQPTLPLGTLALVGVAGGLTAVALCIVSYRQQAAVATPVPVP